MDIIEQEEIDDKNSLVDLYDLMELGSRINTKSEILNRDYTLGKTQEPLERWGDNQIKISKLMNSIVTPLEMKAITQFRMEFEAKIRRAIALGNEEEQKKLEETYDRYFGEDADRKLKFNFSEVITKDLTHEITVKLIFTRSRDGKVLDAILTTGKREESAKEASGLAKFLGMQPKQKDEDKEGI